MLINFTNHPSTKWSTEQLVAAHEYGSICDVPFPNVDPEGDENYIRELATQKAAEIAALKPAAVLCQGEMTLAFAVVEILHKYNIIALAACSKREVSETLGENGKTIKCTEFRFVRFRKYCQL